MYMGLAFNIYLLCGVLFTIATLTANHRAGTFIVVNKTLNNFEVLRRITAILIIVVGYIGQILLWPIALFYICLNFNQVSYSLLRIQLKSGKHIKTKRRKKNDFRRNFV